MPTFNNRFNANQIAPVNVGNAYVQGRAMRMAFEQDKQQMQLTQMQIEQLPAQLKLEQDKARRDAQQRHFDNLMKIAGYQLKKTELENKPPPTKGGGQFAVNPATGKYEQVTPYAPAKPGSLSITPPKVPTRAEQERFDDAFDKKELTGGYGFRSGDEDKVRNWISDRAKQIQVQQAKLGNPVMLGDAIAQATEEVKGGIRKPTNPTFFGDDDAEFEPNFYQPGNPSVGQIYTDAQGKRWRLSQLSRDGDHQFVPAD